MWGWERWGSIGGSRWKRWEGSADWGWDWGIAAVERLKASADAVTDSVTDAVMEAAETQTVSDGPEERQRPGKERQPCNQVLCNCTPIKYDLIFC